MITRIGRYILILISLLCICTSGLLSQEVEKYSFSFEKTSLKNILKEITDVTGYKFAYSASRIDVSQPLTFSVRDATLKEIMDSLCSECQVSAEFIGKTIVLTPDHKPDSYVVTGIVFDTRESGPIPWVSVSTLNNVRGTLTDSLGMFRIQLHSDQRQLRFSHMGYKTKIIEIGEDFPLRVFLEEDIKTLDELVFVAFGKENRDLIGGSVSVINPSVFRQLNNESVNSSLQTAVPGLLVQNNAGTPASAINITIRGVSSITAGNNPLYIVDGIPVIKGNYSQLDFSGQTLDAITDLNINDIESISVLKDAAAASLYGASASNGVILINTKQGSKKGNQFHVDAYSGLQATSGKLSLLNAPEFMNLVNEKAFAAGDSAIYSEDDILENTTDTDWLNEVFTIAPVNNFYMSMSGGNEKSGYYLSGDYYNQEGIVIGSNYRRYTFRFNYDYELSDRLSFSCGNGFSYSRNSRIEGDQSLNGPLPVGISMPPIYPVLNPDGSYNNDGPYANPVSIANDEKNLASSYRYLFNFAVNYSLRENLKIRSQTGFDFYNLGEHTFAPNITRQGSKYNGLGIEATNNTFLLYNSTFLNYSYDRLSHHFSILGGFSLEKYRKHGTYLRAQNFPGSSFEFLQDAATPIIASSNELDASSGSLFASVKYNYSDIYLFSFNLRRDGSSKFGRNNRFGYFPSVSGLWYVSREDFWKPNPVITKFKLKASYGQTGNDQISDFISLDLFTAGSNYGGQAGISPYQLSNPDLKWETTTQLNTGLEIGLGNAVQFSAEYYNKITKDLLLENPIPPSTGFSYYISNIGSIQNQGVEIELTSAIKQKSFSWNGSLSFSANKNKVLKLYQDQSIRNIGRASSSIEVGQPVSYFYGFLSEGVNPDDGLLIYKDIVKDGKITDLDRTKIGNPFPLFFGGFLNTFAYKSFSFHFLVYYSYGNDIFNSTRLYTETLSIGNQSTAVLDRWKKPGDRTDIPKASNYNERISSRFVEDGSFIRLKNVKLSYMIPERLYRSIGLESAELYIAGKNLVSFTKYSGMDPEVNYNSSNPMVFGTDFFTCPQPKSIVTGICVKF